MKYNIQDDIGNHFLDHAVQQLKVGKKFSLVLDNIDWDVKVRHEVRQTEYKYPCSRHKYCLWLCQLWSPT